MRDIFSSMSFCARSAGVRPRSSGVAAAGPFGILFALNHVLRAPEFLLGHGVRRIDRVGFLKFGHRLFQLAGGTELLSRADASHACLEADALDRKLVRAVGGIFQHRLLVEVERGFPLLANLRVMAFFQVLLAFASLRIRAGKNGSTASISAKKVAKTLKTDML